MQRIVVASFLMVALGCDGNRADTPVERDQADGVEESEELSSLVAEKVEQRLDARLSAIEASLGQIESQLNVLAEEVKSAQIQQERLAALETEIKQALVDLGNVMRRAIGSQNVRQPDVVREPR